MLETTDVKENKDAIRINIYYMSIFTLHHENIKFDISCSCSLISKYKLLLDIKGKVQCVILGASKGSQIPFWTLH